LDRIELGRFAMKYPAASWVASLPRELERRIVLGVEFIPAEDIDLEVWKPVFSISKYVPDDLLISTGSSQEKQIRKLHLARTEVEVENQTQLNTGNVARETVYPRIRRAVLVIEAASRTGHIYVAPSIKIGDERGMREDWLGESGGRPQGWPDEDLLELMEDVFKNCADKLFQRKIENALIHWAESKEEPRDALRIAKLWTVLDALLKDKRERDLKIQTRTIALAKKKSIKPIELLSETSWRISFDSDKLNEQLKSFLRKAYGIRNEVYHAAEEPSLDPKMPLDLTSLSQVSILKMAEFARSGLTWRQTIDRLDRHRIE